MTHDAETVERVAASLDYDAKLTILRKSRRDWAFAATVMFLAHVLIIIMELAQ